MSSLGKQRLVQAVQILEAVESASRTSPEVTVADVAHQLGIDRSGASRFIADAVDVGYLRRTPSAVDGRRAVHVVTTEGRELLARSHAWQDDKFTTLTAHWPADDAHRFASYLRRLSDEVVAPRG